MVFDKKFILKGKYFMHVSRISSTMIGFSHHHLDWHQLGNRYVFVRTYSWGANCSMLRNKFRQDTLKLNGFWYRYASSCVYFLLLLFFKGFHNLIYIFDFHLIRKFVQSPESTHAICCYLTRYYCLNKLIQPCAFTSFELFVLYVYVFSLSPYLLQCLQIFY